MSSRNIVYSASPSKTSFSDGPVTPDNKASSRSILFSPAVERLQGVRDSLSTLNGEIKQDLAKTREESQSKFYEVREMASKVEKQLTEEMKRRQESDRVLQTMFDSRLNAIQDIFEKKIAERYSKLQITNDMLAKRVNTLEKQLAEEQEKNATISEDIKLTLLSRIDDLKQQVETEHVNRLEKEAQILKQQAEDIVRASDRIETEKITREQQIAQLSDEMAATHRDTMKTHEHFKQFVTEELDHVKQQLRAESKAREETNEQMVQNIHQIVHQIEDSIRMVSKNK